MGHADFQLANGGVIGRDHRQTSKNYQDASLVERAEHYSLAIVADGCGSGVHSEIGAGIGVRLLAAALRTELDMSGNDTVNWARVQRQVLAKVGSLVVDMGGHFRRTVEEYFLFTVNGVLLTDQTATFFALGDGVIIVNDTEQSLGPFPGNMPPYLGYGLLPNELRIDPESVVLQPVLEKPLHEVDHFLLGSDGVADFITAADKPLPGQSTICGPISQFWVNDRYFGSNPELVSRQLRLAGRDWPRREPQPGLLPDDTTFVVGRQPPREE